MSEIKRGTRVRVSYEGVYANPRGDDGHYVEIEVAGGFGYQATAPASATIEVIEEPFEEGAIYQSRIGSHLLYSPTPEDDRSWVFVSGDRTLGWKMGDRIGTVCEPVRKLAPVE